MARQYLCHMRYPLLIVYHSTKGSQMYISLDLSLDYISHITSLQHLQHCESTILTSNHRPSESFTVSGKVSTVTIGQDAETRF